MRLGTVAAATMMLGFGTGSAAHPLNDTAAIGVVRGFLDEVRSGRDPDAAARYFAPKVQAHQVTSEGAVTVVRTPAEYAQHVREFLALYGRYEFRVEEMMAQGDRVYARWRQTGRHIGSVHGEAPSGAPLIEISSAVYRVSGGRIVEYWIQTDRKGLDLQLERLAPGARAAASKSIAPGAASAGMLACDIRSSQGDQLSRPEGSVSR